jgi:putative serine protease PepD
VSGPPEEPENGEPGRDEGGADPDEPESPLRGWIDPDDRLWRHPSEVAPGGGRTGQAGPVLSPPPKRGYRGPLMVFIGAAAVLAVGAFIAVLLSPASQQPLGGSGRNAGDASLTTITSSETGVPAAAQTAARSMVRLRAQTAHGTVTLIGIAVAEGGMVVTTADLLSGVQSIAMVGAGGKLERASIVGTDATSDVALVNVPEDVPVAPFSDDTGLAGGAPDIALGYVPAGTGASALHATSGSVMSVGAAITSGPANGMAAITSSPAPSSATGGIPLLNASGAVVGILCDPATSTSSAATFLPTQLFVGVADDLRSGNKVVHGVLGVVGSDVANGGGAKVVSVYSDSPAVGHLQVGEVIVAVNSLPVRTFAELRSRLYVLSPGSAVAVSVHGAPGASGNKVVNVTLSSSSSSPH